MLCAFWQTNHTFVLKRLLLCDCVLPLTTGSPGEPRAGAKLLGLLNIMVGNQGGVTQRPSQGVVGSGDLTPKRSGGTALPLERDAVGGLEQGLRRGGLPRDYDKGYLVFPKDTWYLAQLLARSGLWLSDVRGMVLIYPADCLECHRDQIKLE